MDGEGDGGGMGDGMERGRLEGWDAGVGVAGMALTSRRWWRRALMEELDGVEEVMEELEESSFGEGKELSLIGRFILPLCAKLGTLLPIVAALLRVLSSTSLVSATKESSLRDMAEEALSKEAMDTSVLRLASRFVCPSREDAASAPSSLTIPTEEQ